MQSLSDWAGKVMICAGVVCAGGLSATVASAEAYEFHAKYVERETSKEIVIPLAKGTHLPQWTNNYTLKGIYFRPKSDGYSKQQLSQLRSMTVTALPCHGHEVEAGACPDDGKKVTTTIEAPFAATEIQVFDGQKLCANTTVPRVELEVIARFSDAYLCAQELVMRLDPARTRTVEATTAQPDGQRRADAKAPKAGTDWATVIFGDPQGDTAQRGVITDLLLRTGKLQGDDGRPLLHSYCGELQKVAWDRVHAQSPVDHPAQRKENTPDELKRAQHRQLAQALARWLKRSGWSNPEAEDTMVAERSTFGSVTVLKSFGAELELLEVDDSDGRALTDLVHHGSQIWLRIKPSSPLCSHLPGGCGGLADKLTVHVEATNKDGELEKKKGALKSVDGTTWRLDVDMKQYLGKTVTFVVTNRMGDVEFELVRSRARVEDIGLVTSFPVVSEIVSAAQADEINPWESGFTSSIPISWAIRINKEGEGARTSNFAVTFPWMIGFNTRRMPRLSEYVKFFPHASVIVPATQPEEGGGRKPDVAVGAGVALAKAFTFSVGTTLNGDTRTYFLAGISIPDLARVWK